MLSDKNHSQQRIFNCDIYDTLLWKIHSMAGSLSFYELYLIEVKWFPFYMILNLIKKWKRLKKAWNFLSILKTALSNACENMVGILWMRWNLWRDCGSSQGKIRISFQISKLPWSKSTLSSEAMSLWWSVQLS